jgi:hypothetical protein
VLHCASWATLQSEPKWPFHFNYSPSASLPRLDLWGRFFTTAIYRMGGGELFLRLLMLLSFYCTRVFASAKLRVDFTCFKLHVSLGLKLQWR